MKIIITLVFLLHFTFCFSQWTKVRQLPSSDISGLYRRDSSLYAGGIRIVYFTKNNGQTWDSTSIIPQATLVDNIIVYKDELYASAFGSGVFKSPDGGITWQNINAGIAPFISGFCEWKGDLYAATLGFSVFKLDPVNRNNWTSFRNGLSSLSENLNCIAGNNNALVAGALANGLYDYLPVNSSTWEERFLTGQISPNERSNDIITAHDSLFLSGSTGRFYLSTNNGLDWTRFGNNLPSSFTSLVNAKQALLAARNVFNGQTDNTFFYYIKKDSLNGQFVPFSFVPDQFTYKMEILGNKLWTASDRGLFYMSLSDLPGISAADDSITLISLPVHYISFDVHLNADKTAGVQWKTADEFNIDHFEVERSADGINWSKLTNISPRLSHEYSYTDQTPFTGKNYYRIKALDLNGAPFYTTIRSITLEEEIKFLISPNPSHDAVFINIAAGNEAQVVLKIFDNKGALVKMQKATVLQGNNQLRLDIGAMANGVYTLRIDSNNGKMKKAIQLLKQ